MLGGGGGGVCNNIGAKPRMFKMSVWLRPAHVLCLVYKQKNTRTYLNLCFEEEQKPYVFGTT